MIVLHKLMPVLVAGVSVLVADLLLQPEAMSSLNDLESKAEDGVMARMPAVLPLEANPAIQLILITDSDLKHFGVIPPNDKLDRKHYANLFKGLIDAHSAVVLVDITFRKDVPAQDSVIRKVLSSIDTGTAQGTEFIFPMFSDITDATKDASEPDGFAYKFQIAKFLQSPLPKVWIGHAIPFAPNDVVSSCVPIRKNHATNQNLWHVALLAAWRFQRIDIVSTPQIANERFAVGSWETVLGGNSDYYITWAEKRDAFAKVNLETAMKEINAKSFARFKDKLIIIAPEKASDDLHTSASFGTVPGHLVTANIVNSALAPGSSRVHWWPRWGEYLWCFVLSLLSAILVGLRRFWCLVGIALPLAIATQAPMLMAMFDRLLMPTIWPSLSVVIAFGISLSLLALRASPIDSRTPGKLVDATVLFSDLEDSTGLVRMLGATKFQEVFGEWIGTCARIIERHGGHLERTTGDGFVAIFNHNSGPAAQQCLDAVLEINVESTRISGKAILKPSFGIESGPVSGGFVIEAGRKVWSSSGTTVNLARRLQTFAGESKESIVVGPIAARTLRESGTVTSLGVHTFKGIEGDVEAFRPATS